MIAITSLLFPAILIAAAVNDVREFKIPNRLVAVLVVAWPLAAVQMGLGLDVMIQSMIAAIAVFVLGFGLYAGRLLGAGDVKLLAAATLWVGAPLVFPFLVKMALVGAVFAFLLLRFRNMPLLMVEAYYPWLTNLHERRDAIPYGVAIAIAGFITWPHTAFFAF